MLIVEPTANWTEREAMRQAAIQEMIASQSDAESGWESYVIGHLRFRRNEPVKFWEIVNKFSKTFGARSRKHRAEVRLILMSTLRDMCRQRKLRRFKRRFLMLAA